MLTTVTAEAGTEKQAGTNPLFNTFNQPADFKNLKPGQIKEAAEKIIEQSRERLKKIYAVKKESRTFDNTMLASDDLTNSLMTMLNTIDLLSNVLPDTTLRNEALQCNAMLQKFGNELRLDEDMYRSVKEYSQLPEAKALTGYKKKYTTETIRDFERSGFALDKAKREELKKLQDHIADISIQFSNNIESHKDILIITEEQSKGLPEDYKKERKLDNGTYQIDLSYPSYYPFMKYCQDEGARKALYLKFSNRAADKNLDLLQQLLTTRKQVADLLGYSSYAEYQVGNKMVKTPKTVWDFENGLIDKVKIKAKRDYDELLDVKRNYIHDATAGTINPWESSFYNNLLLEQKYKLDNQELKKYFELNNVLNGLFSITQNLFGLQYNEVKNPSVWQEDVRLFEVMRDGKLIARFYLDLYPRADKYGHAACFGMISGKMTKNGYQVPSAALVCNFPKPSADQPSLMPHGDVETFFHEFGHVLHNLLTTSDLASFAGTNVAIDFVEAPSQIFENWVWEYDALKLFAKQYQTGEVLPMALYEKMKAAKNVASGLATIQQVFYGTLDFTLHDKFDVKGTTTTTDIVKKLQNEITLYPYLEGSHMQASFGHLTGYGAGYYSYLWSKVYAQDMFSVFKKNGIMDKETGHRYRDIILAKGSTEDELGLVKQFLQRDPNQNAFFESMGLIQN